jgi:hypothetical protein
MNRQIDGLRRIEGIGSEALMSNRKTTLFYAILIAVASLAVGMVIASRLGLSPESSAQTLAAPTMNSAPLGGAVDAGTFRNIAKAVSPASAPSRSSGRRI